MCFVFMDESSVSRPVFFTLSFSQSLSICCFPAITKKVHELVVIKISLIFTPFQVNYTTIKTNYDVDPKTTKKDTIHIL